MNNENKIFENHKRKSMIISIKSIFKNKSYKLHIINYTMMRILAISFVICIKFLYYIYRNLKHGRNGFTIYT
jgi:hypothetical protein